MIRQPNCKPIGNANQINGWATTYRDQGTGLKIQVAPPIQYYAASVSKLSSMITAALAVCAISVPPAMMANMVLDKRRIFIATPKLDTRSSQRSSP